MSNKKNILSVIEQGLLKTEQSASQLSYNDEIVEIIELEEDECIDIEVSSDHLFYANGILTKNSMGIPATADFMMIMGKDEDAMVYKSEVYYKIVKNRLGGRCGTIDHFYWDTKSLKMYDSSEIDTWIEEAVISGDDREVFVKDE
jgi:hypothetical protein